MFDLASAPANLENAQQLFNAAKAAQSTAVQALFLSAMESYYLCSSGPCSGRFRTEAERSAREGFCCRVDIRLAGTQQIAYRRKRLCLRRR